MNIFHKIYLLIKYVLCVIYTLPRDVKALLVLSKIKRKTTNYDRKKTSVIDIFTKWVKNQPNKECIVYDDIVWTFQDLENYSNQIANVFQDKFHLKKGDCVALFMENRPQFVGIWYGLSKLGVITALINTNLKNKVLIHSIEIAKPKIVIYDEELEQAVLQVKENLNSHMNFIRQGQKKPLIEAVHKTIPILENLLLPASKFFDQKETIVGKDVLMYIYTSGTTGLPKPAIIKHNRYIIGGFSFFDAAKLTTEDRFMVTLPIYHSNAGILGVGSALISGATLVLRKKFSVSTFWKDAVKYRCTAFSYVGEVCRYLLNQPPSDQDKKHGVKVALGNGMRVNVHKAFSERFNVKGVEIYATTEGNCCLVNMDGRYGACGFIPLLNLYIPVNILPLYIIKIDNDKVPIRDKNGFCVQCDIGEKGLIVGAIDKSTKSDFSGYANNTQDTQKKVITNLFRKGQNAFNTGDILVMDWFGYTYFVDRTGDTYRWRGENVSTVEVENAISSRIGSQEVIVYGVEIPGEEGRAGMATLSSCLNLDISQLCEWIKTDLPSYAKPLFIRLATELDHTASFKAIKNRLSEEAFNVNLIADSIYYFDVTQKNYRKLTVEIYDQIIRNLIRF